MKSFHGTVSINFSGTGFGEDLSSGGTETVALHRKVGGVRLKLTDWAREPGLITVAGTASDGTVSVNDSFDNTGTDESGEQHYSGPVNDPIGSGALVRFNKRKCDYVIGVNVQVQGVTFSGDEAVKPDDHVFQAGFSHAKAIPNSLKLAGSNVPHVYWGGNHCFHKGAGCYLYDGGWSTDFDTLFRCHSDPPAMACAPPDTPEGTATLSWNLSPKHKK